MFENLQTLFNNLGLMTAALAIGASWVASIVSPNCSFDKLTGARADGHVRELIHRTLEESGRDFEWHEFNAAHAFLRDEGPRYNPALARVCMALLLRFLGER